MQKGEVMFAGDCCYDANDECLVKVNWRNGNDHVDAHGQIRLSHVQHGTS